MIKGIVKYINYKNYIYFYVFLLPFTYFAPQLGALTVILFIWWIKESKKNKDYILKLKELLTFKPMLLMILFILYVCLSYFWSENKDEYNSIMKFYKYFFFILPIIFTSLNKDEAINGFKILALSFGIYGTFSLLIYLNIFTWEGSSSSDPKFLFRYMITGIYLTLGSFLLYYFYKKIDSQNNLIYLILSIICLIGVFINNGRSSQVALIFTLLVFIYFNLKNIKINFKSIILFLVMATITVFVFLNNRPLVNKYNNAIIQLLEYNTKHNYYSSTGQRLKMYSIGLDIYKEEPCFGTGAGDFKDKFHKYVIVNNIKLGWMYNTIHNIYLEYLIKYGLVGLSLFILPFIYLYLIFRKSEYFNLYLFSVVPLSTVFFFDSILLYKPFNNVFIMIFTLLCIIGLNEQKKINNINY